MSHSYDQARPCSKCGDLDGCHISGKVKRHRPLLRKRYTDDGGCGDQECEMSYLPTPKTDAVESYYGQAYPKVVCLCGSTRFKDEFIAANMRETMEGNIVLSVGLLGHAEGLDIDGPLKAILDDLHKRKIDHADEVLVLNVGGYIGSSTRSEIEYAKKHGKKVRYLVETEGDPKHEIVRLVSAEEVERLERMWEGG